MNEAKGKRIRAKRNERGVSQAALGREIGVSGAAVSYWEKGLHLEELSARKTSRLVKALRTNEYWLERGTGPDGPEGAMTEDELALIEAFRQSNKTGQELMAEYAKLIAEKHQQDSDD